MISTEVLETIDLDTDTTTLLSESTMMTEQQCNMEQMEMRDWNPQDNHSSSGGMKYIWFASIMAALGGILFGYDIGIVSGAVLQLKVAFDLDCLQQEMVVSVMLMGAILGSLTGGFIVDFFGRIGIILNAIIFVAGALILALAQTFYILIVGRFIIGFAVSLSAIAECIYISEIAPPKKRGLLVSLNELGITLGLLLSYLVDYAFIDTNNGWRFMFGLSGIPAIFQGLGMVYLPTSPRWLISKGREEEACKMIFLLQGIDDAQDEVNKIKDRLKCEKSHSMCDMFGSIDNMRSRMLIGCGIVFFQQFTGQPTLLYYAPTMFQAIGFKTGPAATLATVGLGVVKVISTTISLLCVDKVGRRHFLLSGASVMTISMVLLWISTQFLSLDNSMTPCGHLINPTQSLHGNYTSVPTVRNSVLTSNITSIVQPTASSTMYQISPSPSANYSNWINLTQNQITPSPIVMPVDNSSISNSSLSDTIKTAGSSPLGKYLSLVALMLFVAAYAFGFGPVSWLVLSEIYPVGIKGRAIAIATVFNWGSNLIVSFTFLDLMVSIGTSWMFFLYSILGVVALSFVYKFVPETKNKSLEKISAELSLRNKQSSQGCLDIQWSRRRRTLRFQQEILQNQLLLGNDDVVL